MTSESPRTDERPGWGARFAHWRERNPIFVLIFFASSLITAMSVLTVATLDVYDRYKRRFEWRSIEYRKLPSRITP